MNEKIINFLSSYIFFWHTLFKPYQIFQKFIYSKLFNTIEKNPLNELQKRAIILDELRSLIVAGAGTGKTSTIIGKVAYLLKSNKAKKEDILVLAYNRDAAGELAERITSNVKESIQVKTFHSLGSLIIKKDTKKRTKLANIVSQENLFKQYIDEIIQYLMKDKKIGDQIIEFYSYLIIPYKDEKEFKSYNEYADWVRTTKFQTIKGEVVKSYGEWFIANFLFKNGIEYVYEESYKSNYYSLERDYKPDFYLVDSKIYIEYYGIDRNGDTLPFIDKEKYLTEIANKRSLHKKGKTKCLEFFYYDIKEGNLLNKLEEEVKKNTIKLQPISDEIILNALNKNNIQSQFSKIVVTFLRHYKSNINKVKIRHLRTKAGKDQRSIAFINIFEKIFNIYQKKLKDSEEIDFEDMIIKASELILSKKFIFNWKYIIIDEFQDISRGRYDLIKSFLEVNPNIKLFCVGDDWQSIYRFAGSDISLMKNFRKYFGPYNTSIVDLDQTFRFNNMIASVSEEFITKNPSQIKKSLKTLTNFDSPQVFIHWIPKEPVNATLTWLEFNKDNINFKGKSLQILSRYTFNKPKTTDLNKFKNLWNGEILNPTTIHSSKGLEADIVLCNDFNSYPGFGFPSSKKDDPLLNLVLAENESFPFAEERRLFYVAITRAKHQSYFITDPHAPSIFCEELSPPEYKIINIDKSKYFGHICPECKTGNIVPKKDLFFGCNNYPVCNYISPSCTECSDGQIEFTTINTVNNKNILKCICNNIKCLKEHKKCPRCSSGILINIPGKYSTFTGCHTFGWTGCKYKEKLILS